jgi:hypothetical protein
MSVSAIHLAPEHNPLCQVPVPQGFSWERHAPAWLLKPGSSPALPGEGTDAELRDGRAVATGHVGFEAGYSPTTTDFTSVYNSRT